MANLNPSAIKDAITNGATWRGDRIMVGNDPKTLDASSGTAWALSASPDDNRIRKHVFDDVKDGVVQQDGTIVVNGLPPQRLSSVDGFAKLVPV